MIAGLALAGGASRRMGADKPLLPLHGRPLIAFVLDRLRGETAAVAISANGDPERFAQFGCPVLPDGAFTGRGPLAGVLAGLDWAASIGADALLTIPADTPFAPAGLVAALSPPPSCAASCGHSHHLVALWPVSALPALRHFLSGSGPYSARHFGRTLRTRSVSFPAMRSQNPFWNVNTPEDLQAVHAADPPTEGDPSI